MQDVINLSESKSSFQMVAVAVSVYEVNFRDTKFFLVAMARKIIGIMLMQKVHKTSLGGCKKLPEANTKYNLIPNSKNKHFQQLKMFIQFLPWM